MRISDMDSAALRTFTKIIDQALLRISAATIFIIRTTRKLFIGLLRSRSVNIDRAAVYEISFASITFNNPADAIKIDRPDRFRFRRIPDFEKDEIGRRKLC